VGTLPSWSCYTGWPRTALCGVGWLPSFALTTAVSSPPCLWAGSSRYSDKPSPADVTRRHDMARVSLDSSRTLSYWIVQWFFRRKYVEVLNPIRVYLVCP
jgi:hypothetical protein